MQLNKICNIEDFGADGRAETMRRILPFFLDQSAGYPAGMEHRKHWEFAQVLLGLEQLGAVGPDAWVLSVAAGNETVVFDLTNRVRWVFATDIYGSGNFTEWEADMRMLRDPDSYALFPYNRRRLVVEYMDALDLRFEDETFDAVYSLSSIEHFGGLDGVRRALDEQRRVVKRGGFVALTTEVVVNGAEPYRDEYLLLATPEQIDEVCRTTPGLRLVEPIDFTVSDLTKLKVKPLGEAIEDSRQGIADYPHILVEEHGRHFTSVSIFFERIA